MKTIKVKASKEYDILIAEGLMDKAGEYIRILAWLCPFMYLSSTLGSILNGLGKVYQTFAISVISLCIKIGCLLLLVPTHGMSAYFFTLLVSQGFTTLAEGIALHNAKNPRKTVN